MAFAISDGSSGTKISDWPACRLQNRDLGIPSIPLSVRNKKQNGKLPRKFRGFHEFRAHKEKTSPSTLLRMCDFCVSQIRKLHTFFVLRSDFKMLWKFVLSRHNVSAQAEHEVLSRNLWNFTIFHNNVCVQSMKCRPKLCGRSMMTSALQWQIFLPFWVLHSTMYAHSQSSWR